jgi:hypothetical protein
VGRVPLLRRLRRRVAEGRSDAFALWQLAAAAVGFR